jgi:hypothetical protein
MTLPSVGLECVRDPVSVLVAFLGEADQGTDPVAQTQDSGGQSSSGQSSGGQGSSGQSSGDLIEQARS